MRLISKNTFLDYWERGVINSQDIIVVGNWVVAKKQVHASTTDMTPFEVVYVVV